MLAFLGIVLGLLLLLGGGAALVTGASQIAERFRVSPMIVGLTIVGFGTSAPELVVNIVGALRGETGLAFGNVIGSNISNLGLVLGIAAIIRRIKLHSDVVRREVPLLLLITTIMTVMALDGFFEGAPAQISRSDSVVLLLLFAIFVYITIQDIILARQKDSLLVEIGEHPIIVSPWISRIQWLLVLLGFALLYLGGELTVRSSVALAGKLGISTTLVGLYVVAIGTSMPELVTSAIAAMRKESDLALGNIIGSNIFNSLIVLPASGLFGRIMVPEGGVTDLVVTWMFTAVLIPVFFLRRARLGRSSGIVLVVAYIAYAVYRVTAT